MEKKKRKRRTKGNRTRLLIMERDERDDKKQNKNETGWIGYIYTLYHGLTCCGHSPDDEFRSTSEARLSSAPELPETKKEWMMEVPSRLIG